MKKTAVNANVAAAQSHTEVEVSAVDVNDLTYSKT